jgi:hypothetical protein
MVSALMIGRMIHRRCEVQRAFPGRPSSPMYTSAIVTLVEAATPLAVFGIALAVITLVRYYTVLSDKQRPHWRVAYDVFSLLYYSFSVSFHSLLTLLHFLNSKFRLYRRKSSSSESRLESHGRTPLKARTESSRQRSICNLHARNWFSKGPPWWMSSGVLTRLVHLVTVKKSKNPVEFKLSNVNTCVLDP